MLNLKFVKFWYTDDTLKLNSANGISYVDRRKRVQIGLSLLTSAKEEGRTSPEQVVQPKKWKQPGKPALLCCVDSRGDEARAAGRAAAAVDAVPPCADAA